MTLNDIIIIHIILRDTDFERVLHVSDFSQRLAVYHGGFKIDQRISWKINYLGKSTRLCRNMKMSSYEIHISTEKRVKRAAEEKQMSRSFPCVQKVRKKEKV